MRYTGSSLTFNLAGIFGASLAPYIATWLAQHYGLQYVGYYVVGTSALTLVGLLAIRETRNQTWNRDRDWGPETGDRRPGTGDYFVTGANFWIRLACSTSPV